MGYIELNGEWYIKHDIRRLDTMDATPYLMKLTLPDLIYIAKEGITDPEELTPERCLELVICFN